MVQLVVTFIVLLLLGFPISFNIIISSLAYLFFGDLNIPYIVIFQNLGYGLNSFILLAIPLYIFAGNLMNEVGVTNRIFNVCLTLVGHMRGGLAQVNVLASMIFAGISGSALADAGGLGVIEMKAMLEEGYDIRFSAAITAASSILGPIIPPSILLIIYGSISNVSVARLFIGGLIPGLILGILMMLMVFFLSAKAKYKMPTRQKATYPEFITSLKRGFLSLIAPVIILVGFFTGIYTPTEGGAVAIGYAIFLGLIHRECSINKIYNALKASALVTVEVLFFVAASRTIGFLLTRNQVPQTIVASVTSVIENPIVLIIFINIFLLIVGTMVSGTAGLIILAPLIIPVWKAYGLNPVHLGLVMCVNLTIGGITPPVGSMLFAVSKITKLEIFSIAKAMIPFYIILLFGLFVISYFPALVLFLPNAIFG